MLQMRGVDMVSVSHQARAINFSDGIQLGHNDHIVEWPKQVFDRQRITREEYDALPDTIQVREFEIDIETREGGEEKAVVVSAMTDPSTSQDELAEL